MSAAEQLALFEAPPPDAVAPESDAVATAATASPTEPCLADRIMVALERQVALAEQQHQELRELHAEILGCTVDELDARIAEEEAKQKAELEAIRAQRPGRAKSSGRGRRAAQSDETSGRIGASALTERQRELLHNVRVEGNVAVYVPEERIPDWDLLKRVMVALGGKWRSRKGFVFPDDVDARELVRLALETGEILDPRKADFFATPAPLADRVAALADLRPGDRVLEPSAGRGAIALAVRRACPDARVLCVEPLPDNRAALEAEGFELIGEDFLELEPFDSIEAFRHARHPPEGLVSGAARERTASLVRLGWGPERFRAAAQELRASCSSVHVGWGLEVARHELADEYEAEAARLEKMRAA